MKREDFLPDFLQIKRMMLLQNVHIKNIRSILLLLFCGMIIPACAPSISQFNETAYQQAVHLKVKSLTMADKATGPYSDHVSEIEALKQELDTAYEYAKGRPKNEISARQWEILIDPERNLMGGFLIRWEEQGVLSPVFIQEFRGVISDAFDTIIGLESGKVKPEEVR